MTVHDDLAADVRDTLARDMAAAYNLTEEEAQRRISLVLRDLEKAAERDGEGPRPTSAGGAGKEESYWLRAKTNASIRHLRDIEDYYRVELGGTPDSPNMVRADRARSLYEQISDDFLNGNTHVQTMRERAEAAEAALTEQNDALDRAYQARDDWKLEAEQLRKERDDWKVEAQISEEDKIALRQGLIKRNKEAVAAEARCAQLEQALAWVMSTTSEDGLGEWERVTLTREPNRADWFRYLPEMDYQVKGGTFDEPRWAFVEHPWFAALGLTNEECCEALADTPADSQPELGDATSLLDDTQDDAT